MGLIGFASQHLSRNVPIQTLLADPDTGTRYKTLSLGYRNLHPRTELLRSQNRIRKKKPQMLESTPTDGSYVPAPFRLCPKTFWAPSSSGTSFRATVRFMDPSTTVANEVGNFPNLFVCRTSGLGGFGLFLLPGFALRASHSLLDISPQTLSLKTLKA